MDKLWVGAENLPAEETFATVACEMMTTVLKDNLQIIDRRKVHTKVHKKSHRTH